MKNLFNIPKDSKTTDGTEVYMKRLWIDFKNGNAISIIQGEGSYGGKQGFYEIMPEDKNNCLTGTDLELTGDSVKGWLTIEDVNKYIEILSK